jgi:aminoglycoside phosphotransferase (APT) family kinase protein
VNSVGRDVLASGRDADVFALDEWRVLRRYRDGGDVSVEAAVMSHVSAAGFPVPQVHAAEGPDLVMERVDGPTMLEAFMTGELVAGVAAGMLADLLAQLHALPTLTRGRPADRILHLDLHPGNVILDPARGPVVIDWRNTREGPPALDVAMTALIPAEAAAGSFVSREQVPVVREFLVSFLARVGESATLMLSEAAALRTANPTLSTSEVARVEEATALIRATVSGR